MTKMNQIWYKSFQTPLEHTAAISSMPGEFSHGVFDMVVETFVVFHSCKHRLRHRFQQFIVDKINNTRFKFRANRDKMLRETICKFKWPPYCKPTTKLISNVEDVSVISVRKLNICPKFRTQLLELSWKKTRFLI